MKKTNRGFNIYSEFKDSYQNTISVQESSAAMRECVWIFVKNKDGKDGALHMGEWQAATAHLTKPQARRLAKALLKFAGESK